MPTIQKAYQLDITPQQFIDACDEAELQELDLLLTTRVNHCTKLKDLKVFEPKLQGPETGHHGDMKRCTLCGYYKKTP